MAASIIDLGVTNKFQQIGKFVNMRSEKNEDQLCDNQMKMGCVKNLEP